MRTSKLALAVITIGLAVSSALAADAADRRFLRDGMSEGEVLMKVGKPDSESEDSGGGAKVREKRWIYFPAPGDQQTLTTLTIRDGRVIEVRREIAR